MKRKGIDAIGLCKIGTKFSSNLQRLSYEVIVDMEDGGRARRMFT